MRFFAGTAGLWAETWPDILTSGNYALFADPINMYPTWASRGSFDLREADGFGSGDFQIAMLGGTPADKTVNGWADFTTNPTQFDSVKIQASVQWVSSDGHPSRFIIDYGTMVGGVYTVKGTLFDELLSTNVGSYIDYEATLSEADFGYKFADLENIRIRVWCYRGSSYLSSATVRAHAYLECTGADVHEILPAGYDLDKYASASNLTSCNRDDTTFCEMIGVDGFFYNNGYPALEIYAAADAGIPVAGRKKMEFAVDYEVTGGESGTYDDLDLVFSTDYSNTVWERLEVQTIPTVRYKTANRCAVGDWTSVDDFDMAHMAKFRVFGDMSSPPLNIELKLYQFFISIWVPTEAVIVTTVFLSALSNFATGLEPLNVLKSAMVIPAAFLDSFLVAPNSNVSKGAVDIDFETLDSFMLPQTIRIHNVLIIDYIIPVSLLSTSTTIMSTSTSVSLAIVQAFLLAATTDIPLTDVVPLTVYSPINSLNSQISIEGTNIIPGEVFVDIFPVYLNSDIEDSRTSVGTISFTVNPMSTVSELNGILKELGAVAISQQALGLEVDTVPTLSHTNLRIAYLKALKVCKELLSLDIGGAPRAVKFKFSRVKEPTTSTRSSVSSHVHNKVEAVKTRAISINCFKRRKK